LKYVDFKNWQPRPSWLFFFCGTLFLLTSLCGTNEEIFSEFQPSFQCNVCLCVWYVLSVLAQHTPHTFFLIDRNYDWGWWYSGPLYFKEWICSISAITNFIPQMWIYCLSSVDYHVLTLRNRITVLQWGFFTFISAYCETSHHYHSATRTLPFSFSHIAKMETIYACSLNDLDERFNERLRKLMKDSRTFLCLVQSENFH